MNDESVKSILQMIVIEIYFPRTYVIHFYLSKLQNVVSVTGFEGTQHYIITSDGDLVIQGVRGDPNPSKSDEGVYFCRAENMNGHVDSKRAWLIIYC